ncbi:MAG: hypothetical protein DHS20C11_06370 [Lysobacteraceae bacterium]|nr:MAG: hypothetical protein DHS20C11_06370 [Xanthomonadaceae bacterium]
MRAVTLTLALVFAASCGDDSGKRKSKRDVWERHAEIINDRTFSVDELKQRFRRYPIEISPEQLVVLETVSSDRSPCGNLSYRLEIELGPDGMSNKAALEETASC